MENLLIGLVPPEELREKILQAKQYVRRRIGYQLQVDEYPHCTLCLGAFSRVSGVEKTLKRIASDCLTIGTKTAGVDAQAMDMRHTTLWVSLQRSRPMRRLQKRVVHSLSSHIRGSLLSSYMQLHHPGHSFSRTEKANLERYGYPYIGKSWSPHFTIASVRKVNSKFILPAIQGSWENSAFVFSGLTLFRWSNHWIPKRFIPFSSTATDLRK